MKTFCTNICPIFNKYIRPHIFYFCKTCIMMLKFHMHVWIIDENNNDFDFPLVWTVVCWYNFVLHFVSHITFYNLPSAMYGRRLYEYVRCSYELHLRLGAREYWTCLYACWLARRMTPVQHFHDFHAFSYISISYALRLRFGRGSFVPGAFSLQPFSDICSCKSVRRASSKFASSICAIELARGLWAGGPPRWEGDCIV